ncbi:MAG: biotin--[acetyl-CoA-carboxylase] ligase [Simkaniaceae bacterium]|nr:biotin--[acetyl-CoA-carboxylase] ligase [Simkaniaceae bacterium]MCF7852572.1 biotin--[acetyl-CoA-carboxylase] ligase [Simkaniaceae bacterium]
MIEKITPIFLERIDSTTRYAKEHYAQFDAGELGVIYTSHQTHGLGTHNRAWISLPHQNLLTTFCFDYQEERYPHQYTQILSICVIELLATFGIRGQIKWPNDLIVNGKKIAGILAEPIQDHHVMLIGIGLNVNMQDTSMIDQPATSIFLENHREYDIAHVVEMLAQSFAEKINQFHQEGFSPILKIYDRHLAFVNQLVRVDGIEGYVRSISKEGFLLLEDLHYKVHCIQSGSLRHLT